MRTPVRLAGLSVSFVVVAAAVLILPDLATATGEPPPEPATPSAAVNLPLTAPAQMQGSLDPALPDTAPVSDLATQAEAAQTQSAAGDRTVSSPAMPSDADQWTPERMANAEPAPMPMLLPPAVAAPPAVSTETTGTRSAPVTASDDPNRPVSSPVMPSGAGYWTPERMANAKPMPMPTPR